MKNTKIKQRSLAQLQVGFHPMHHWRARTIAASFHALPQHWFSLQLFRCACIQYLLLLPSFLLLTTLNYSVITLTVVTLHYFPTSLPGQAGGIGAFKSRHSGARPHCWVLHVNSCMEEAVCSTSGFTDPPKDETSLWILKFLNSY